MSLISDVLQSPPSLPGTGLTLALSLKTEEDPMNKYLLSPMAFVLISLVSGCTTEKHYPAPPQTVIYEEKPAPADTRSSDAREAAREGAREGARDTYR